MQRTPVIATTTAVALVTGAVLAVSGGAQAPGGQTIQLVTKNCAFKFVDVAPRSRGRNSPPGAGDSFTLSCRAENPAGERVGSLNVSCTFTKGGRKFGGVCTGIYRLSNGEIHGIAPVGQRKTSGSVVGGTGAYAGARGTFTSVDRPGTKDGDPSDDTLTLLP